MYTTTYFIKFFAGNDYAGAVVTAWNQESAKEMLLDYMDELEYAEVNIVAVIELTDEVGVKSIVNTNG
ncbi:MAG: hypothetical protein DRJ03_22865 [Chloroflexi bacterium]|nr:MAG: hypothetical protein DRJ03_22865 [Chloroflexota bacterium]